MTPGGVRRGGVVDSEVMTPTRRWMCLLRPRNARRPKQDWTKPLLQPAVQFKWVELRPLLPQPPLGCGIHLRAPQQPLARGLRRVVPPLHLGSLPTLLLQLHGGQEEVVQRLPALPVERVDRLDQLRIFKAVVPQEPPDVRPVL